MFANHQRTATSFSSVPRSCKIFEYRDSNKTSFRRMLSSFFTAAKIARNNTSREKNGTFGNNEISASFNLMPYSSRMSLGGSALEFGTSILSIAVTKLLTQKSKSVLSSASVLFEMYPRRIGKVMLFATEEKARQNCTVLSCPSPEFYDIFRNTHY